MLYEQYFIDDLQDRADLVRIIERHARMKKLSRSLQMKLFILAGVVIVLLPIGVISQTLDEDSNWFKLVKDRDDHNSRFDFTRYSVEDVLRAARTYKQIEETHPADEWEGVYSTQVGIGEAELRWRGSQGFVFHDVYHTLSYLKYGKVVAGLPTIRLIAGDAARKRNSPLFTDRLIKVKFGKKHYLVPESRLTDFAERAVGREFTELNEWQWWQRIDEYDFPVEGLPLLPRKYAHIVVSPIKTSISRVGQRRVIPSADTTPKVNYDDIYISVTLAHGRNKGIKVGMDFFIPDLGEWVEVVRVNRSWSAGRIRRDFGLEGDEQCWDSDRGSGMHHPCKKLITGLTAVTKPFEGF